MLFYVAPVVGSKVPLLQVIRRATGAVHLVTNNENKAQAAALALHDVVTFKARAYEAAGYHILAACTLDPSYAKTKELQWSVWDIAVLDDAWYAKVTQFGDDGMVELRIVGPHSIVQGAPVLFHSVEEAKAAAVCVYLRRFPRALTKEIFSAC